MSLLQRLPTLQDASDAGLIPADHKVLELKQLAAIVVMAHFVRRETWRESKQLDASDLGQLPMKPPPITPGGFSSWLVRTNLGVSVLEHVTDKTQDFRDVFVTSAITSSPSLFGVESAIEELVPIAPPPELECKDLRETGPSAAYRGAMTGNKRPSFHGFDFDDAYDQAKTTVTELYQRGRGRLVTATIRAYGWPMLWVRTNAPGPEAEIIILPDGGWQLRALTGRELVERENERD